MAGGARVNGTFRFDVAAGIIAVPSLTRKVRHDEQRDKTDERRDEKFFIVIIPPSEFRLTQSHATRSPPEAARARRANRAKRLRGVGLSRKYERKSLEPRAVECERRDIERPICAVDQIEARPTAIHILLPSCDGE